MVDLGLGGPTPEKSASAPAGRPLLRLDRGGGGDVGAPGAEARAAIGWGAAVLVADYGRGVAAEPELRDALAGVALRWSGTRIRAAPRRSPERRW